MTDYLQKTLDNKLDNKSKSSSKSTKANYSSDLEVRWCSGCGDYHVLNALKSTFSSLGLETKDIVLVSGIGCSSRLPYYCSTYGFHSVHGRAPCVALGIKLACQDLSVWVITGDGDGLSIGTNHLIHACRRNLNINILLFNNEIYGLTKGQASPTSKPGLKTISTPRGVNDYRLSGLSLAIASQATFAARVVDTQIHLMKEIFTEAYHHQGTSFVEIYTNCVIFNDGAFKDVSKKTLREENSLILEKNKPLVFGKNKTKALIFDNFSTKVINITADDLNNPNIPFVKHQPGLIDPSYALWLSQLDLPQYPLPLGILRQINLNTFESNYCDINSNVNGDSFIDDLSKHKNYLSIDKILNQGNFNRL